MTITHKILKRHERSYPDSSREVIELLMSTDGLYRVRVEHVGSGLDMTGFCYEGDNLNTAHRVYTRMGGVS